MTSQHKEYKVLSFYKFIEINNPSYLVRKHYKFCNDIGLKGRVYIGKEGINATVSGNFGQIQAYKLFLKSSKYFKFIKDIDIKAQYVDGHVFDRMIVKHKDEIVVMGKTYNPENIRKKSKKISIDEFKKILDGDKDSDEYIILDMRNDYEYELGHFKGAVPASTVNFRDIKTKVREYKKKYKLKKIIPYCTGGIRCEKASALLREEGLDNIYELDGGVLKYVNTYNDGNWLGNLLTFDNRISVYVGDENTHTTIARCHYTGLTTNHFENCRYTPCNARLLCRREKYKKFYGFCSRECFENAKQDLLIKNNDFDEWDYKSIRKEIKNNPNLFEYYKELVSNKLDTKLKGKKFPYKKSVKPQGMFDKK